MSENETIALLRDAYIAELEAPPSIKQMIRVWWLERQLNKALNNRNKK